MNIYSAANLLAENEARIIENYEFDINGDMLKTRGGLSAPIYTFATNIKGVFFDYEMNVYLVFLINNSVYKYVEGQSPLLLGTLTGSNKPVCCKFGGKVLIASGGDLQYYDYTNLITISASPLCDITFERFGRVAIAKAGTDNIYYSAVGDETDWIDDPNVDSSSKVIEIGYKDGGDIAGIAVLATDIIVFKSNGKIYQLAGEFPDWSVYQIATDSDFVYRHGVATLGNEIVFMSRQGLKTVSTSTDYGNFNVKDFGFKVNGELKKYVYHPIIWNIKRKKQLLIRPNEDTRILAYHYLMGAFTLLKFPQIVVDIVDTPTGVVLAMGASLYKWSFDYATDNGTPIVQYIKSKRVESPERLILKKLLFSITSDTAGTSTLKVNGVTFPFNWTETLQDKKYMTNIRDRKFEFEFETSTKHIFNHIQAEVVT